MGDGGAAAAREAPAGQAATQGHVLPPEASDAGEWNQIEREGFSAVLPPILALLLLFQSSKCYFFFFLHMGLLELLTLTWIIHH